MARPGWSRQGLTRHGRRGEAGRGLAWLGKAGPGKVWQAWLGVAGLGGAWPGVARPGAAGAARRSRRGVRSLFTFSVYSTGAMRW